MNKGQLIHIIMTIFYIGCYTYIMNDINLTVGDRFFNVFLFCMMHVFTFGFNIFNDNYKKN